MVPPSTSTSVAAPIVSADRAVLVFGDSPKELTCLSVQVDARSRRDVADFLTRWRRCCDLVAIDWRSVRRPQSALVGVELRHCCGDDPEASLRLVFDVNRDREALETLASTEAIVVGNRPYGGFANSMVAYGLDAKLVRAAMTAAERGLQRLVAVAS